MKSIQWLALGIALAALPSTPAITRGAAAVQSSDVIDLRTFAQARLAIDTNDYDALIAMLDKGLSPKAASPEDGYTLLHLAASNWRVDMVRELLRRGADPAAKTPRYGFTPVDSAGSNVTIIDMLIAAGGPRPIGYKPAAPRQSTPARAAPRSAAPASPKTAAKPKAQTPREKQCAAKQYADAALCSDSSCRMATYRKWQQCLKTGQYW